MNRTLVVKLTTNVIEQGQHTTVMNPKVFHLSQKNVSIIILMKHTAKGVPIKQAYFSGLSLSSCFCGSLWLNSGTFIVGI